MLSKSHRLNLKKEFTWVAAGKKLQTHFLKLFYRMDLQRPDDSPQIGVAVSSKNFKKAHQRVRIKRVVMAAFERIYQSLPNGLEIMALPKREALELKSDQLSDDLKGFLKKL